MTVKGSLAIGRQGAEAGRPATARALPAVRFLTAEQAQEDHALQAAWGQLALAASEPNPFAEGWYLSAAFSALAAASGVHLATVWDQGLIGVIPLRLSARYARLPLKHVANWLNHNAFLGVPLVRAGAEDDFWRALLDHLDRTSGQGYFLHLTGMPVGGQLANALETACAAQGRRCALVHREERALLERGLSPDAYLEANMRGKKRKELRRQHNRLAELGKLEFDRSDGSAGLNDWIGEFLGLERLGWKGRAGSALDCADETRALFSGALHGAASAGRLELLALRLDGRAVAMLANFITPPGSFSFKTAFDEDYARFSPGVLLQIENLKLLERADIDWCDSCAAQDHPMIDSIWSGRRAIGRYSVAIGGPLRRTAFTALLAAEKTKARLRGINAAKPNMSDGTDP